MPEIALDGWVSVTGGQLGMPRQKFFRAVASFIHRQVADCYASIANERPGPLSYHLVMRSQIDDTANAKIHY
jgi:hypothetical protein